MNATIQKTHSLVLAGCVAGTLLLAAPLAGWAALAGESNKQKALDLLDALNSGDSSAIEAVDPESYFQRSAGESGGLKGIGELIENPPEGGFKAKVHRAFYDGEFVVTHTEYDFFGPKVGFDVFRFKDGLIVEHWDNLTAIAPPNPSGRTQLDGTAEITDLDLTHENKKLVMDFFNEVLVAGNMGKVTDYLSTETYLQHNPMVADGLEGLSEATEFLVNNGMVMEYTKLNKVLGQGNFVLAMSEGRFGKGEPAEYYDLFRIEKGKIVEHWDVIETATAK